MKQRVFLCILAYSFVVQASGDDSFIINLGKELNVYFPELVLQNGEKYYPRFDIFDSQGYTKQEWLAARSNYIQKRKTAKNVTTFFSVMGSDHETEKVQKQLEKEFDRLCQEYQCAICLNPMESAVQTTQCKKPHQFHKACFERWKVEKNICPKCRTVTDVTAEELTELGLFAKNEKRKRGKK